MNSPEFDRKLKESLRRAILREAEGAPSIPSFETLDGSSNRSMITLYRVAFSNQVESIFKNGYKRDFTGTKGGNMYGPGVYCTFRLEDSVNNVRTKPEYGNCIIEMRLVGGFNKFVIFDETWAKRIYGQNWQIKDQIRAITGMDEYVCRNIESECSRESSLYNGRTAPAAYYLWRKYRSGLFEKHGVRGLIYKGNRDGHCALPYDFSSVIPFGVSYDQGRTFKKLFNQELYNNITDHIDTKFRYGGKYHAVFRAIKGFTMVKDSNEHYNIIASSNDKPISPFWFDEVKGSIDPIDGTFGFTYGGFEFNGSINTPQGGEGIGCVLDPYGDPYCDFSDLNEVVSAIKESGCSSFREYYESEDEEEGVDESLVRAIQGIVREVIRESREVSEDGTVTIDNFDDIEKLLDPQSDDDVWFVQVIKRHKDNMSLHFDRNACEYITYYLVHDAKELESKREEIKSVCKATNSRAYIHPNKRSMVAISDYANNVLRRRFEKYHNRHKKGHEIEIAAGQAKDWDDRKLCFLDIDSDDEKVYNKVIDLLSQHGIQPMWEYRSLNNGWHLLLPDKEEARKIDFSVIDNGNKFGRFSTVGLEIDKPLLLYASLKPNGYQLQQRVQQHKLRNGNRR